MGGEAPAGLTLMEKIFGLLLIIMGLIAVYYAWQTQGLEHFGLGFFVTFGIVLIALGIFMVLAKAEER